jgi:hypothetical protein
MTKARRPIIAIFDSGEGVQYTTDVLELLKTEPDVWAIQDYETGELLYMRED